MDIVKKHKVELAHRSKLIWIGKAFDNQNEYGLKEKDYKMYCVDCGTWHFMVQKDGITLTQCWLTSNM